jgi:hypothetical protein
MCALGAPLAHRTDGRATDLASGWSSHCVFGHGCAKKHRDDGASATAATCFSCPRSLATPSHRFPPRYLAAPARRRWVHRVPRAMSSTHSRVVGAPAPSLVMACCGETGQGTQAPGAEADGDRHPPAHAHLRLPHEIGRLRPACLMHTRGQWFQALGDVEKQFKGTDVDCPLPIPWGLCD